MAKSLMIPYHPRILNPKFQMIWPKNKVARALPCLAWAPPNLADRQHSATGFSFGPFAKLFLVRLIWNFGFKFLIYKENCIPIASWIEENTEHPNVGTSAKNNWCGDFPPVSMALRKNLWREGRAKVPLQFLRPWETLNSRIFEDSREILENSRNSRTRMRAILGLRIFWG